MYYQTDNNKKGKVFGSIATAAYVLMWVLLIVFVSFDLTPEQTEDGILIDFGDSDQGFGKTDMALVSSLTPQSNVSQSSVEEQITTQDFEQAPEVSVPDNKNTEQSTQDTPSTQEQETPPTPAPRQVNQQALFKGRTEQSGSASEGSTQGVGNQGNLEGSPQGDHAGTGQGTSGNSFNLTGRNLIGALPIPEYGADDQGKIVIQIVVSPKGDVTSASFQSAGSTTQNGTLVNAALRAAREAKFNVADSTTPQQGTITYIFRMQ